MKKGTIKIAGIIAVLIVILLVFAWAFGDGGALDTGFGEIGNRVNNVWQTITGDSDSDILDGSLFEEDVSDVSTDLND